MDTPQQPPTPATPEDPPATLPAGTPAGSPPVPPGRRLRLVVALLGGVAALLCLGGGLIAFTMYDKATKLDRSRPDMVAIQYVGDLFTRRDRERAELWTCDGARLPAAERMLDDIVGIEQRLDTNVLVHWEGVTVRPISRTTTEVRLQIRMSGEVDGIQQSFADPLTLKLEDRDGWRVCAAKAA